MITCVAFDLDDTLYKERDFVRSGYTAVANTYAGQCRLSPDELLDIMLNADNAFDTLLYNLHHWGHENVSINDLLTIYRHHQPTISLPASSIRLLEWLRSHDIAMAVATDGRSYTQWNKIRALGIDRFIPKDNIIVSEDIGFDKTTIHPFEAIAHRIKADRYFYIGDNPAKDFHYPNIIGWTSVMLKDTNRINVHAQDLASYPTEYRPAIIVDNLEDVKNLI